MQKRCLQYRQVENAISSRTNGLDYHYGNLILKNGKPDMYLFDGGYYSFDGYYKPECHYYIADYQGNNRMVVNARTNEVVQTTHYYPYGGIIGNLSSNQEAQKYKYSGKALAATEKVDNLRREREALAEGMDRTYGLDLYDFHARLFNPALPVFDRPDPLSEKFTWLTPYNYCAGDPVNCIDPTGMDTYNVVDSGMVQVVRNDAANTIKGTKPNGEQTEMSLDESQVKVLETILNTQGSEDNKTSVSATVDKSSLSKKSAKQLFYFFAKCSNVEWSFTSTNSKSGTNHKLF